MRTKDFLAEGSPARRQLERLLMVLGTAPDDKDDEEEDKEEKDKDKKKEKRLNDKKAKRMQKMKDALNSSVDDLFSKDLDLIRATLVAAFAPLYSRGQVTENRALRNP